MSWLYFFVFKFEHKDTITHSGKTKVNSNNLLGQTEDLYSFC